MQPSTMCISFFWAPVIAKQDDYTFGPPPNFAPSVSKGQALQTATARLSGVHFVFPFHADGNQSGWSAG